MPWGRGRPINESRMVAELAGEKTYRGSTHGCGTNERYVNGGACVHCARRIQREQREARAADLESQRQDMETNSFNAPAGDPWD